jgi:valyl-tRNA synthetase
MDETRLGILEKTGSTDMQELVTEVRRLRKALKVSDQRHADFVHGDYNKLQEARHAANREMVAATAALHELSDAVLASPTSDAACVVIANRVRPVPRM